MRTATSRTFENADGTFTTELHAQPIYYQELETADWVPIDLRFSQVKGKHHQPDWALVGASPVQVSAFPTDHEQGFLTLAAGDQTLALARPTADDAAVAPVIADDGRTLDYPAFYGAGTGLRVLARPDGMRTFVVLSSVPDVNDFAFHLTGDGLLPVAEVDGSVILTDASGATVARIPRPVFMDSSDIDGSGGGLFAAAASVSVVPDETGLLVTLHVARRFLEEAVYPAFVDLTLADFPVAAPGADVNFVSSRHPDSVFAGEERPEQPSYAEALLGRQPGSHADNTTYLSFDDPRAVIGSGRVATASLELYPYWGSPAGVKFSVSSVGSVDAPATELGTIDLLPGAWADTLLSALPDGAVAISAVMPGQGSWTRLIARDQSAEYAFGPRLVITWSPVVPTPWSVLEPQHGDD
jgi:hypothetical protein